MSDAIYKLAARIAAEIQQGVKPAQDDALKKLKLIAEDAKLIQRAAARIYRLAVTNRSASFVLASRRSARKRKPWQNAHQGNGAAQPKQGWGAHMTEAARKAWKAKLSAAAKARWKKIKEART